VPFILYSLFLITGAFGGKLKNLSAADLGVLSCNAALEHANLNGDKVDGISFTLFIFSIKLQVI